MHTSKDSVSPNHPTPNHPTKRTSPLAHLHVVGLGGLAAHALGDATGALAGLFTLQAETKRQGMSAISVRHCAPKYQGTKLLMRTMYVSGTATL